MPAWLEARAGEVRIRVHAQPGAKKSGIAGTHGDALKIKLHAPPVDGKANEELTRFLADLLGCRRNQVGLASGAQSREKVVAVQGIAADAVVRHIEEHIA